MIKMNTDKIRKKMEKALQDGLEATMEDLRQETYDVSRVKSGETRSSYKTNVEKVGPLEFKGRIGSSHRLPATSEGKVYNNAKLEEFGTGIYNEKGDGRKTPWRYYDADNKVWVTTRGKRPHKPMRTALANRKAFLQQHLIDSFEKEGLR